MPVLLVAAVALTASPADDVPREVVEWLSGRSKAAPAIETVVAAGERSDRVVILGRAFPGTIELAELEGAVAAVARPGDVVALDVGPREGDALDRWIHGGDGDVGELIGKLAPVGWSAGPLRTWLQALRERETKPHLAGIGVGDPRAICSEALVFVAKAVPEMRTRAELALLPLSLESRNGEPRYFQLDDSQRFVLRVGLDELVEVVRNSEEDLVKATSAAEYRRGLHLLVQLQHYETWMRFLRAPEDHDPRGRILADATLELLQASGEGARVFALVEQRDLARRSDSDSFAAQLQSLGGLRATCVGTVCSRGTFLALDPNRTGTEGHVPRELTVTPDDAGALERALQRVGAERPWILDLRTAPAAEVSGWLTAHPSLRSSRSVCGGPRETPWDHDVLGDFDALVWFPVLRAAASASAAPR